MTYTDQTFEPAIVVTHSSDKDIPTIAWKFEQDQLHFERCKFYERNQAQENWHVPQQTTESCKLSCCRSAIFDNCDFFGGVEDCFDAVRGNVIIFNACRFWSSHADSTRARLLNHAMTKQHVTVKGSIRRVMLERCDFIGPTQSKFSIKVGDWTDYDYVKRPPCESIAIKGCRWFANSAHHTFDFPSKADLLPRMVLGINVKQVLYTPHEQGHFRKGIVIPQPLPKVFFALKRNKIIPTKRNPIPFSKEEEPWLYA